MHYNKLTLLILPLLLAGCSTVKTPETIGGSKSDGIVKLAYEYGSFQIPKVQWDEATAKANNHCQAWGYEGAQPFEASQKSCVNYTNEGTCVRWQVTSSYQCIG